jgi:dTDP-4-dehydrorhamnose 3,5-epimerase
VIYKVDDFWAPECEGGVQWNDPALNIAWPPFAGAQVAAKDATLPPLSQLDTPFVFGAARPAQ